MAKRKKAGRKPLPGGRDKFTTTLPPRVKRWLMRDGNASEKIVRWAESEMAKEQADNQTKEGRSS